MSNSIECEVYNEIQDGDVNLEMLIQEIIYGYIDKNNVAQFGYSMYDIEEHDPGTANKIDRVVTEEAQSIAQKIRFVVDGICEYYTPNMDLKNNLIEEEQNDRD